MLNSIHQLTGSTIRATDGDIGKVKAAYFDDQRWAIRYLVVDTGGWLTGRSVLISPYAVQPPLKEDKCIPVRLSREQVKNSPDIDTHKPVARQHEQAYLDYYGYPEYWEGGGLWAMGAVPVMSIDRHDVEVAAAARARIATDHPGRRTPVRLADGCFRQPRQCRGPARQARTERHSVQHRGTRPCRSLQVP